MQTIAMSKCPQNYYRGFPNSRKCYNYETCQSNC